MVLKMRAGMLFLVIALCAMISVASAATGTGAGVSEVTENLIEDVENLVDEVAETTEELVEEVEAAVEEEATTEEEEETEPVDTSIEGQLLSAAQKLSANMSEKEIESVINNLYDNVNGAVMVYVISPKGVIDAVYPSEYDAAIGDFIVRSPVGGMVLKAREYFQTNEYTSAREKITGYDAVQPIISSDDEYLGAIIVKFSN